MAALAFLAALALLLAYANGANDVSKGISTLVGSGVSNFRAAVLWGSVWTAAGGVAAAFASQGLVATFSGNGFLDRPASHATFPAAVALGSVAWVFFASRTGLPVSTTHALAGALAGVGLVAQWTGPLHWGFLARRVALPLALSPLLALALVYAVFSPLGRALRRVDRYCVCIQRRATIGIAGALELSPVAQTTVVASEGECERSPLVAARLPAVDALHWFSSAGTSFARALNDAPKILALGAAAAAIGVRGIPFYAAVAAAMGAGSLVAGFRVTETLARRVTPMSPTEGFAANLVTTLLVATASLASLPVSTTHVCSGAIVGIGLRRGARSVRWRTVGEMGLAWIVTIPAAALGGALAFVLLRAL